eukprot:TRINITY_DN11944_c0_g1_i1.p1 TRINITY_DN11944_c0_g1~~TRINITY_DN11944_c0_g1_i1.p1  ORF type:complete len:189 (+),score=30.30 TRINITY_DN11944_c0_g1_i1:43-567(+)
MDLNAYKSHTFYVSSNGVTANYPASYTNATMSQPNPNSTNFVHIQNYPTMHNDSSNVNQGHDHPKMTLDRSATTPFTLVESPTMYTTNNNNFISPTNTVNVDNSNGPNNTRNTSDRINCILESLSDQKLTELAHRMSEHGNNENEEEMEEIILLHFNEYLKSILKNVNTIPENN